MPSPLKWPEFVLSVIAPHLPRRDPFNYPQHLRNVALTDARAGMSEGYKNLYSGKEDKRGRFQWQTTVPEDLGKPAEDAESEKWAIIKRNVKAYNDPKKVLSIHSVVIQSPLIKELLTEVLAGYPGVTVNLKRLEFSGRYVAANSEVA